ncbi:amidase family protein [Streptomyces europaeiscabiei]|uniref:amidase family protein n=1 Tax=Streptomyces europaeiscabiei TaxID=146819 RepID=UPI0029BA9CBD|nr:amidase family protein [Streptomyces europaeiscabiei]MDX2525292.1 amidase family protein [Streptomyces europaeiscabiei]
MTASDEELWWWPAGQVADAIATRRLSAREYLAALLDRVERLNPVLNAVVAVDERAHAQAAAADEAVMRGQPLGPFHGVAMTVKDCMATSGLRTTGGLPGLASHVPRDDAAAVAALRGAGAVVFGKTNVPAGSGDLQAYNELFGVTRNPWDLRRSPSGSSGGAAAAVAAGLSPLEVGSDVAGSIRLPAAMCGVFGHKPSHGLVPTHGHVPPAPYKPGSVDMNVVGPLARTVDDLRAVLTVIAAPHPWDQAAWRVSLPPARPLRRVATWFDDPYCPVDATVRRALEDAAQLLSADGVVVEDARPPGIRLEASDLVFRRLLTGVAVHSYSARDVEAVARGERPPGDELGGRFVGQSYRDWAEADDRRTRMRARWRQFFSEYDAILLPVAPNTSIAHDHRPFAERRILVDGTERPYWDQIVWAGLTGVSYLPSTVVPVGLDALGAPIGLAVAGPYLEDLTTLAVARRLASLLPPLGHAPLARTDDAAASAAAVAN